jgi:predicted TIM-barrel fold metal-dependent hydrolase
MFGTDFPPGGSSREVAELLAGLRMFDASAMRAIDRENAVKLLPRLKNSVT